MRDFFNQIRQITVMAEPEKEEAIKLLYKAKAELRRKLLLIFFACLPICMIVLTPILYQLIKDISLLVGFVISIPISFAISYITIDIIKLHYLKPYYELIKIAKHNDLVRHDEMIRFKERTRLEGSILKDNLTRVEISNKIDVTKSNLKIDD